MLEGREVNSGSRRLRKVSSWMMILRPIVRDGRTSSFALTMPRKSRFICTVYSLLHPSRHKQQAKLSICIASRELIKRNYALRSFATKKGSHITSNPLKSPINKARKVFELILVFAPKG